MTRPVRRPPEPIHAVLESADAKARGHEPSRVCRCRPRIAFGLTTPGLRVFVHAPGDCRDLERSDEAPKP